MAIRSRTINITGVGDVVLERSRRARHICLTVRPFKGVRVAVPAGVSFEAAEAVARSKTEWLQRHLDRMAAFEKEAEALSRSHPFPIRDAASLLAERLRILADLHGFVYDRVYVRRQKTRWGSCSARNHIHLNVNLARLPDRLIDYALLHELVHTRIKNHGPGFWVALDRCLPGARALDRELDRFSGLLL
ncbi:MAG: M48 family metallopeptidase [Desulfobacterales bacterium]